MITTCHFDHLSLRSGIKCEGINLFLADGAAAMQKSLRNERTRRYKGLLR